jgi:hypothetical protein
MAEPVPTALPASAPSRAVAIRRYTRALWRALVPSLVPDPRRPGWSERYLLQVCESGISRVAADPHSEPMVARSLFAAARSLISAQDQLRASLVIEAHVSRARAFFEAERGASGIPGSTPRCAALNRKGKPCAREPIWGTPFCVSHTPRPDPEGVV